MPELVYRSTDVNCYIILYNYTRSIEEVEVDLEENQCSGGSLEFSADTTESSLPTAPPETKEV